METDRIMTSPDWREILSHSYGVFFTGFSRLTPVQIHGMPPILAGRPVLLAAPTASGKTEAFAAPAAEIVLGAPHRGQLLVLIVSPTRALANDLKRRLEARYAELHISFGRRTGEHKETVNGRLPEVVVTTPESLDSLLARRPNSLRTLRLIVLDEIHVLDGTPRGDQLRILLERLDAAAGHPVQRVLSSATVEDPHSTADRYAPRAELVTPEGRRKILAKAFHGRSVSDVARHLDALAAQGFRKVLAFCNSRRDVETFAVKLKGVTAFRESVSPHHGSLARRERERTERHFQDAPIGVLFSTMTLEMGIDIGTVDYVLLMSPPPDVSSLLQRIGRGGRRTGASRAGYILARPADAILFETLFAAGAGGRLLGRTYAFRPGVLVQQALVLAGSRGWVDAPSFREGVAAPFWKEIAPTSPEEILVAMAEAEYLEPSSGGRFVLGEDRERRYDRGSLHSNIDDEITQDVVDRMTGDVIGHLDTQETQSKLGLSGEGREVVMRRAGRILTDRTGPEEAARFASRGAPTCSFAQGRAVAQRVGAAHHDLVLGEGLGSVFLLHGLGSVGGLWLHQAVEHLYGRGFVERSTPYVLRLRGPIDALPPSDAAAFERFVAQHEPKLAAIAAMGPYHAVLPEALRRRAVAPAAELPGLMTFLQTARLVPLRDTRISLDVLADLA